MTRGHVPHRREPNPDSSLPYLLRLPIDGGLALKAKKDWPRAARVYCHLVDGGWPDGVDAVR